MSIGDYRYCPFCKEWVKVDESSTAGEYHHPDPRRGQETMTESPPALALENVSKRFGRIRAVEVDVPGTGSP